MSSRVQQATELFAQGYNCSQAVFGAFAPSLGLSIDDAVRIACPFGGGMGRSGGRCGALTGAMMALGMFEASALPNTEAKLRVYDRTRQLVEAFRERNGSLACNDLLGYDISSADELRAAKEADVFRTVCPKLVQSAAEILESMLERERL